MGYQITRDTIPISITLLNAKVAELWGKPYDMEVGTRPFKALKFEEFSTLNVEFEGTIWAEKLLTVITEFPCEDLEGLWCSFNDYIEKHANYDNDVIKASIDYNKPYFDVIDYFKDNGFEFLYVSDEPEAV